ncbi:MAG: hypothetical protein WEB04_08360 [Dehalococcoidia bacterium]
MSEELQDRFAALSGGTKRMLEYVAVLDGEARYAILRHLARVSEEDMVEDVKEAVDAGIIAVRPGEPNVYEFTEASVREWVLSQIGETRLPKLRARAAAARWRVVG